MLGAVGRTLITGGVLILLFVAYQLWGTGIYTSRAQDKGEAEFEEQLAAVGTFEADTTTTSPVITPPDSSSSTQVTTPVSTAPPSEAPPVGDPVGRIVIPKLGSDWIFFQGVDLGNLKKGPGHYPDTPLPGQAGNAAIAGHRTTYGAPFGNVDQLVKGDDIVITTLQGEFLYKVIDTQIVSPSAFEVLDDAHTQAPNTLTLTSCHPKYTARQRIVIVAELQGTPLPVSLPPGGEVAPGQARLSVDPAGLSGEAASNTPAILWGLGAAAIWVLAWLLGRVWNKWAAYAIGLPFFLVVLFFFFDNFARLLPANY
jgi:sortase A